MPERMFSLWWVERDGRPVQSSRSRSQSNTSHMRRTTLVMHRVELQAMSKLHAKLCHGWQAGG
jgi:hypothetical protein